MTNDSQGSGCCGGNKASAPETTTEAPAASAGCCGGAGHAHGAWGTTGTTGTTDTTSATRTARTETAAATADDDLTTCPVMVGRPVGKKAAEAAGLFRDHEGQRYWFCCAGCGPAFDADPARYAAATA